MADSDSSEDLGNPLSRSGYEREQKNAMGYGRSIPSSSNNFLDGSSPRGSQPKNQSKKMNSVSQSVMQPSRISSSGARPGSAYDFKGAMSPNKTSNLSSVSKSVMGNPSEMDHGAMSAMHMSNA
jgi:hypothetical protein